MRKVAVAMIHGGILRGTGGCRGGMKLGQGAGVGENPEKCSRERWTLLREVIMDCEGGASGLMKTLRPWSSNTALHFISRANCGK